MQFFKRMIFRNFIVFVLIIPAHSISHAQNSGRIYFRDGEVQEVSDFRLIKTELYYFHRMYSFFNREQESIDLIREYPVANLKNISFQYEKGKGTDQFYYQLLIEGINASGSKFRKKVQTWDWLEISSPEAPSTRNTEIVFYTEKKRFDILRIEFDSRKF